MSHKPTPPRSSRQPRAALPPPPPSIGNAEVIAHLGSAARAVKVSSAARDVPDGPGLYSIFVDSPASLPEPYRGLLVAAKTRLLYVGSAKRSLYARLVEQELRHKRAATFFRGLGAILGYRPVAGSLAGKRNQRNYRFSPADTAAVIAWIEQHLRVELAQFDEPDIRRLEPLVIAALCPLLNTTHNPRCFADLVALREECRRIARTP